MGTKLRFLLLLTMYVSASVAFPADGNSMVVSSTEPPKETSSEVTSTKEDTAPIVPKIYEMKVNTNVTNRFAKTAVVSKVRNLAKSAQEATFSVVLPETAYISGFVMEIDGQSYTAYVKEKEEAKQIYDEAVSHGQAAAHVAANARDSNRFTVSVNVEPQKKAIFTLTYEELLQRQNEQYEIVINIHPGQPVKDLNVEVHINETRPLKFVKSPPLRSGNEISKNDDDKLASQADVHLENSTTATVKFNPNVERQKQLATGLGTSEENGLAGQFVVQYDVERDPQGGEVLLKDGYFVHFFAPSDIPPLPKQVVFVLDTSGSMDGVRVRQLKEAMNSILAELKKEDLFNIVEFSSTVKVWNIDKVQVDYELGDDPYPIYPETEAPKKNKTEQVLPPPYPANEENVNKAKQVVEKLNAYGGTDIKSALEVGLKLVKKSKEDESNKNQPIIVFLTDGEPTVGETMPDRITSAISEINTGALKTPIFSLSFGDGADRTFLQKISLQNLGFARHIYEAADASLQLQEFYKQISSPLLNDVHFKYVSNVTKLTKTEFPIFFHGSELVIAGVYEDEGFAPPKIYGNGFKGPIEWTPKVEHPVGDLERLWAYLTVKQVLEARDAAENKTLYTKKALDTALKYSFVTDVSSLVVVKPNDTSAVNTQDASKGSDYNNPHFANRNYHTLGGGGAGFGAPPTLSLPSSLYSRVSVRGPSPQPVSLADPLYDSEPDDIGTLMAPDTYDPYVDLKTAMPWISGILQPNGTLTTPSGAPTLSLGQFSAPAYASAALPPRPQDYPVVAQEPLVPFVTSPAAELEEVATAVPDRYEEIKNKLPWLKDILHEDGTLTTPSGPLTTPISFSGFAAKPGRPIAAPGTALIVGGPPPPQPLGYNPPPLQVADRFVYSEAAVPVWDKTSNVTLTEKPATSTVAQDPYEDMKSKLPWLKDILQENGTLTTPSGNYKLATGEDRVAEHPECPLTPVNRTAGICTLLKDCPQVFPHLTDAEVFGKYFCPLDKYAGICCPIATTGSISS